MKTLRHPNILRYIADFENENQIILVTERVYPVIQNIDEIMASSETRLWFLHVLLVDLLLVFSLTKFILRKGLDF